MEKNLTFVVKGRMQVLPANLSRKSFTVKSGGAVKVYVAALISPSPEVRRLSFSGMPVKGHALFVCEGSISTLALNAVNEDGIQTALSKFPSFARARVTEVEGGFEIKCHGAPFPTPTIQVVGNTFETSGKPCVQHLSFDKVPTSGSFRLSFKIKDKDAVREVISSPFSYNVTAPLLEGALRALLGESLFSVEGSFSDGFTFTWGSPGPKILTTISASSLRSHAAYETQTVDIETDLHHFELQYGEHVLMLPMGASAKAIASELKQIPGLEKVEVHGSADLFSVTFTGVEHPTFLYTPNGTVSITTPYSGNPGPCKASISMEYAGASKSGVDLNFETIIQAEDQVEELPLVGFLISGCKGRVYVEAENAVVEISEIF